jgi:Tfp pilus assembly ATPase PilU
MKTLSLSLLMLISVSAFADNFSHEARQDRHDTYATHEEMEAIYSNPQGLQNIDERFWNLYNKASDNLGNASNKVNITNTFTWQHDMAGLSQPNRNQYQSLLNQERPLVQQWIEQRNQLIKIINTAKQGGLDTTNYEQSLQNLMNTANNLESQIAQRPY